MERFYNIPQSTGSNNVYKVISFTQFSSHSVHCISKWVVEYNGVVIYLKSNWNVTSV